MRLDLSRIRTPHERFEQVYPPEAFAPDPESFRVVAPVSLAFDIFKDNDQFRLTGHTKTTLELPCSRCLEPLTTPDDLSTAFYENDEIDLQQLMREQFYLALPMKPLCSDSCRGLCPVCGTNLNRGTCDCKRDWDDPRLAALRELRTKN